MLARSSRNKLITITSTALIIGLVVLVLFLLLEVRSLYHDHLKHDRLNLYKNDLDVISEHFSSVNDDIDQVGKEFDTTNDILSRRVHHGH
jgi:hypothetical protein